MKIKLRVARVRIEGKYVWEWVFTKGRKFLFGGYCATKAGAQNDADYIANQENIHP